MYIEYHHTPVIWYSMYFLKYVYIHMDKVILEFTLNGRKNTYLRRIDMYGKPLTTTNKNSAKMIKERDILGIWKLLLQEYGKQNLKDMNIIKKDE